jgi:hypothetical protein
MANSTDESNSGKTEPGKTEPGNTETGNTGNQNTETGKAETDKAVCDQTKKKKAPNNEPTRPLNQVEKYVAGILLIVFLVAPAAFIVGAWPDRVPGPKEPVKPLYIREAFHVRLVCVPDTPCCVDTFFVESKKADTTKVDTTKKDAGVAQAAKNSTPQPPVVGQRPFYLIKDLVDLNIIVLLLVAAAGFLGNMIYVATSFTTFVGAGKFDRSWMLWYFVKPFTGAALALGLYFVFRGGLLSYSADAPGINLYGVITIAILAGLFTDKATLKLKEIFEVVFTLKKDDRPGTLGQSVHKFISVTPTKLSRTDLNPIVIKGEGLNSGSFHIKMNSVVVPPGDVAKTATTMSFSYKVPVPPPDITQVLMVVTDDQDKVVFQQTFTL